MLVLYAVALVLFVYAAVDVLSTPGSQVRTLPRPAWSVVLLLPLFGPILWLLCGRPARGTARARTRPPSRRAPDDDDEFLRELRRRADDQRRRRRDPRDPPDQTP